MFYKICCSGIFLIKKCHQESKETFTLFYQYIMYFSYWTRICCIHLHWYSMLLHVSIQPIITTLQLMLGNVWFLSHLTTYCVIQLCVHARRRADALKGFDVFLSNFIDKKNHYPLDSTIQPSHNQLHESEHKPVGPKCERGQPLDLLPPHYLDSRRSCARCPRDSGPELWQ